MRCIKCGSDNLNKANFCKDCGYEFNDDERRIAKRHTLVGKLELLESAYKVCTLNVITGHIAFKVGSLIIVILLGFYFMFYNGSDVKILDGSQYNIEYNIKSNEYYLLVNEDTVSLNLYIPNKNKKLSIEHYDKENNLINSEEFKEDEKVVLNTNYEEDYYVLISDNGNIKFFVYRTEV